MSNITPFKKQISVGSITLDFKFEMLEDGSLWYCSKLSTQDNWSEWMKFELGGFVEL